MSVLFLGSTLLGALGFVLLLLPLGFVVAWATGVGNFRALPRSTQVLWSVTLSTPLAIMLAVLLERFISVRTAGWGAVVLAVLGWAFIASRGRGPRLPAAEAKYVRWGLALAAVVGLYVILAGLPIQVGDRLFDSLSTADLSVRVPLVQMATEHGMPVVNPFNSIDGFHPAMRYYYYWYILCGIVARVFHLPPRAAITASGFWAALMLLSSGFLLLSTLFRPRDWSGSVRRLCLLTVPVGAIIGLDILPVGGALLLHPPIFYPDPDYWRSPSDFAPSFNLAMLYAPHHVAGIAISFLLFLLILPQREALMLPANLRESRGHIADRAALAGVCLAMLVGTSTYMAMFACIGGAFVLISRLRRGDRQTAAVVLGGAAFGLLLSLPFLWEITHVQAHLQLAGQHSHMLRFSPHAVIMTKELMEMLYYRTGYNPSRPIEFFWRGIILLLLVACELGFLGIVLAMRIRKGWAARHDLQPRQVYQWMLFFAIAIPGLFFSSSSIAGSNDLSRHAEVCLRFFGVLWAVPVVCRYLLDRDWRIRVNGTWVGKLALVLVAIGLSTEAYQVFAQRFYSMYSEHMWMAHRGEYRQPVNYANYTHDVFYAFQKLNEPGAPAGNVLYDPMGDFWRLLNLYQTRYAVAGEKNCMTAFGGDIARCEAQMPAILRVFGGLQRDPDTKYPEPYDRASMTVDALNAICVRDNAGVVIALDQDPAWSNPDSFVWQSPVLYATPRVRMLRCGSLQP